MNGEVVDFGTPAASWWQRTIAIDVLADPDRLRALDLDTLR
ncbi:hypothetical protein ACQP00_15490 [Dactylosporangium sp. CS-047395]